MSERSLKNAFGNILRHTGHQTNAYFRITDLLGDKPSRALDTVLLKTGQKDDFDPRATARARAASNVFLRQLKEALRLKKSGASTQTQKLLLAQALRKFLGATKRGKISKIVFEQAKRKFAEVAKLNNEPETETERKERAKKEAVVKKKEERGSTKKIQATKTEGKKEALPSVVVAEEKIKVQLKNIEDEIEEDTRELKEEILEEIKEQLQKAALVGGLDWGEKFDLAEKITQMMLGGNLGVVTKLKEAGAPGLDNLLPDIAFNLKIEGREDLANQVAGQMEDKKYREMTLEGLAKVSPNPSPSTTGTTGQPAEEMATTPPTASPTSPEIQVKITEENQKNNGGNNLNDPEHISQTPQSTETENKQQATSSSAPEKIGAWSDGEAISEGKEKTDSQQHQKQPAIVQNLPTPQTATTKIELNEATAPSSSSVDLPISQKNELEQEQTNALPNSSPPDTQVPAVSTPHGETDKKQIQLSSEELKPKKNGTESPATPKANIATAGPSTINTTPSPSVPTKTPVPAKPAVSPDFTISTPPPLEGVSSTPVTDTSGAATPPLSVPTQGNQTELTNKKNTLQPEDNQPVAATPDELPSSPLSEGPAEEKLPETTPKEPTDARAEADRTPATLSPDEQSEVGSGLDGDRAKAAKDKTNEVPGGEGSPLPGGEPGETPPDMAESEESEDPQLGNAKRAVNKVARPLKGFMNFPQLQQINRQMKELDKKIRDKKKGLKKARRAIIIGRLRGAFGQCCCIWWTLVGPLIIAVLFLVRLAVQKDNIFSEKIVKELKSLEKEKDDLLKRRENLLNVFKAYNIREQQATQDENQNPEQSNS